MCSVFPPPPPGFGSSPPSPFDFTGTLSFFDFPFQNSPPFFLVQALPFPPFHLSALLTCVPFPLEFSARSSSFLSYSRKGLGPGNACQPGEPSSLRMDGFLLPKALPFPFLPVRTRSFVQRFSLSVPYSPLSIFFTFSCFSEMKTAPSPPPKSCHEPPSHVFSLNEPTFPSPKCLGGVGPDAPFSPRCPKSRFRAPFQPF